jgi:DNA-binding Lrp family transcriptional regulator
MNDLDRHDVALLTELQRDSRQTVQQLAAASRWRCISISRTSACVPVRKTDPPLAQRLSLRR